MTQLQRLEQKVDALSSNVEEVMLLIYNNQKTGQPGIHQILDKYGGRIERVEQEIRDIKEKGRYHAWLLTGGGAVGGGAFVLIIKSAGAKILQLLF